MQPWWLTCVYGPQGDYNKILFLQEIRNLRACCQGPWLVVGDFNLITSIEDKNNGNINRAMMGRFRRLMNGLEFRDLPLQGANSRGLTSRIHQHLSNWTEHFVHQSGNSFFPTACYNVLPQKGWIIAHYS